MKLSLGFKKKLDIPHGLFMRCNECSSLVYRREVEEGLHVCPKCDYHFPLTARQRIDSLLDEGSFVEAYTDMRPTDPLAFVDREAYSHRLERYQAQTGMHDAAVVGRGAIDSQDVMFGVTDYHFMAGSMGCVVGEKIARIAEDAANDRLALLIVCGSGGGARMQEGILSLMQMAKTSCTLARLHSSGGLFITVLTDPTMGGTMASFASQGDIVIAEPGALIGFTGPRVIQETIKQKLPDGFQRSEFCLEHGLVDMIVHRRDLKLRLADLIRFLTG